MICQPNCGACCIAPSITSPIPGMPNGKKAGEVCLHLDEQRKCQIFGNTNRPKVCINFAPCPELCGNGPANALETLKRLEIETQP